MEAALFKCKGVIDETVDFGAQGRFGVVIALASLFLLDWGSTDHLDYRDGLYPRVRASVHGQIFWLEDGWFCSNSAGGVASIKMRPHLEQRFWVIYAGPFVGLMQILALLMINGYFGSPHLCKMAYLWAFCNLFNLLPVYPLDGGQIAWAIGSSIDRSWYQVFEFVELIVVGLLLSFIPFLGVFVLVFMALGWRMFARDNRRVRRALQMNWGQITLAIGLTLVLIISLLYVMVKMSPFAHTP